MKGKDVLEMKGIQQRIEASDADLSGSSFLKVGISGARFDDVTPAGATIQNANLKDSHWSNVNLSGFVFATRT